MRFKYFQKTSRNYTIIACLHLRGGAFFSYILANINNFKQNVLILSGFYQQMLHVQDQSPRNCIIIVCFYYVWPTEVWRSMCTQKLHPDARTAHFYSGLETNNH